MTDSEALSIYDTPNPSEFARAVITDVAETVLALDPCAICPDNWYQALAWVLDERAPA